MIPQVGKEVGGTAGLNPVGSPKRNASFVGRKVGQGIQDCNKRSDFFKIGEVFANCVKNANRARLTRLNEFITRRLEVIRPQTTGIRGWFHSFSQSGKELIQERKALEEFVGAIREVQENIEKKMRVELEKKVMDLANKGEHIANTAKNLNTDDNLTGMFNLEVKSGQTVEQAADELIQLIQREVDRDPKVLTFQGKVVAEINRKPIIDLKNKFEGNESEAWKEALRDCLAKKNATTVGVSYICQPLLNEILRIKTQKDADHIAYFLMSEVCAPQANLRRVNLDKLRSLLNHPAVKDNFLLKRAVIEAAKKTQLEDIRTRQVQVVWDCLTNREDKVRWNEEAQKIKDSVECIDLDGIYKIAEKVNIPFPSPLPRSEQLLADSLASFVENLKKLQDMA